MQTDNRLGTMDDVLAGVSPDLVPIVLRLRDHIIRLDPDTIEQPRPGDRALSYGMGPKKNSEHYAYIMPQKGYVNLGFYHGATLPDPNGLLEGAGKALRHVKVRSLTQADDAAISDLVAAAVAERASGLGLV